MLAKILQLAVSFVRAHKVLPRCHSVVSGFRFTCLAIALAASSVAQGTQYYEWQVASGDWSVASNWGQVPGGLPTSSDEATIENDFSCSITKTNEFCTRLFIGKFQGGGTIQMSDGGLSVAQYLYVGYVNPGTLNQTGGTVDVGVNAYIGELTTATYNLGGGLLHVGSDEYLNYYGSGTVIQTGGTNSSERLYSSMYSLSGSGLLSVAFEGLGGNFNQSGGTNAVSYLLNLSDGTYNLSGTSSLSAPTEETAFSGTTATFNQSGGTNSVGILQVGFQAGSSGTYNQFAGLNSVSQIILGIQAGSLGTFNLSGGVLTVGGITQMSGTANFNFGGGTLQASSGFSTSVPMTLGNSAGGAIFDTSSYIVTLSGSLSGAGGLTKYGVGTLALEATNSFSGNTLICGGTLSLGSPLALQQSTLEISGKGAVSFELLTSATLGGLSGSGAINLSNTASGAVAIIVGNNNTSTIYSGALNGPGSLTKIGTGTFTLGGNNTFTGGTNIVQGTLQVGAGGSGECLASPAISNNGSLVFNHADTLTYPGSISGTGGLTKTGTGTLILTGSNAYSGSTTIAQGKLTVNGILENSTLMVNSGGVLAGTGSLSSVTVNPGGRLAPGDALVRSTSTGRWF